MGDIFGADAVRMKGPSRGSNPGGRRLLIRCEMERRLSLLRRIAPFRCF